jgi:DNA polymerase-3 subunit gamma/tau
MNEPQNKTDSYTVVARRYRPTNFDQLIGQIQVSTALQNAIQHNRVGHAYLFTGARGVGKTSTARIFAKCLNCEKGPTIDPCNRCDACQSISVGEDVDVLEIDGASNRGIDEIRQLRSNANIRPSRSKYKIYVIDEVHMLTREAFNALLKTLEEPPGHVKFIFCTTDPEKIPITVLSRCQRFDFVPVQTDDIKGRLRDIVDNEKVAADDAALSLLAQRAKGSLRDSQSLLEQLLSFTTGRITVADVHQLLGTADTGIIIDLANQLVAAEAAAAMTSVASAFAEGVDPGQLTEQLLAFCRDVMAAKVGCSTEIYLQASPDDESRIAEIAERIDLEQLLSMMQILDKTLVSMRYTTHARTLLEMAIVRICALENLVPVSAIVEQLKTGGLSTAAIANAHATSVQAAVSPTKSKKKPEPPPTKVNSPESVTSSTPTPVAETPGSNAAPNSEIKLDNQNVDQHWKRALQQINDTTADMAANYQKLALAGESRLVVTLADSYNKNACERPEKKQRIEQALADVTGRQIRVDFVVANQPDAPQTSTQPVVSRRKIIRELHQHPMMSAAIELFDAEITDFKKIKPK